MNELPSSCENRLGGRVVFLIDESESLRECIAGGTKSKAENIATALNSVLNQLAAVADLEVAVAGYRGDSNGGADVGCRWGGPLAGRRFVPTSALADTPLVVENRLGTLVRPSPASSPKNRKIPHLVRAAVGRGHSARAGLRLLPTPGRGGNDGRDGLEQAAPDRELRGRPVPQQAEAAVERVLGLSSPGGPPLVFHVHLGGTAPGKRCSIHRATYTCRRALPATCSAGRACCRTI